MILNIILLLVFLVVSFPLSHILMKRGMVLDYVTTDKNRKRITKFFYIPYLNVLISISYLIWVIIKFKRPE